MKIFSRLERRGIGSFLYLQLIEWWSLSPSPPYSRLSFQNIHFDFFIKISGVVRRCSVTPLFVTKWIDYTNRYGFGCQFSDGSLCVKFNDGARLCQTNNCKTYQYVAAGSDRLCWYDSNDSKLPCDLQGRIGLLRNFGRYMDQHLMQVWFSFSFFTIAFSLNFSFWT